jgi:hypothetical protein
MESGERQFNRKQATSRNIPPADRVLMRSPAF